MPANPFRFTAPGESAPLFGRKRELDELVTAFREGRNLCLVAPRGSGKSALLLEAEAASRRQGLETVYVDLFPAINPRRFAEIYASALTMGPKKSVEAMQAAVQALVPTLMPRITLSSSGRPGLQLDLWDRERDLRALLERIFAAPTQIAAERKRQLVVFFDDFEDLLVVADDSILQPLAQSIRRQKGVSTCFVLRKESTAAQTFSLPKSPFFKLAEPVVLTEVPEAEVVAALERAFEAAGLAVQADSLLRLTQLAQNVPHYVRLLAHAFFEAGQGAGQAGESELKAALEHVLAGGAYAYRWQWDQLSPLQRNLVLAIAQGYTERLHSQRMVFQLGLGSPSTVAKNLRVLVDREVLQRRDKEMRFVDPLFGLWLQRRLT